MDIPQTALIAAGMITAFFLAQSEYWKAKTARLEYRLKEKESTEKNVAAAEAQNARFEKDKRHRSIWTVDNAERVMLLLFGVLRPVMVLAGIAMLRSFSRSSAPLTLGNSADLLMSFSMLIGGMIWDVKPR